MAYGYSGDKEKAMEVIGILNELPYSKDDISLQYGLIYLSLSEWDKAFQNLEDAINIQEGNSLYTPTFLPDWYPELKDDQNLKKLVDLINSKIK